MKDPIFELMNQELERQQVHIELIASENFVSDNVLKATGSILTNKYAEGYPGRRYYGGCEYIDQIEQLAIDRCKQLFQAEHANVQPHSGSQANMGVYMAVLEHGDTVLGMSLNDGGHLTHGHPLNFSGISYNFHGYGVDPDTECIDYEVVRQKALEVKPKLIVAGASAYPREIDFAKFREICDEVGAYLMVDMAHIAGLVATNEHQSPIPYADFVTSTTHKTLRGPRGGIILCKSQYQKVIDQAMFPGSQGGPLEHVIAAKAVAFEEALQPDFVEYQKQVVKNAKHLANALQDKGVRIVSNGTDNHLLLMDVKASFNMTGKRAQQLLEDIYITTNKNSIPNDLERPMVTSGIRLGTPAMTTRGFKEVEMDLIADIIYTCLSADGNEEVQESCREAVKAVTSRFVMYPTLKY